MTVGVVGLGLIGGSLVKAYKRAGGRADKKRNGRGI